MKLNPKDLQKAMQRMGIQQKEVAAVRVIIECQDKNIVIESPQVAKVNMMGQETWQITGAAKEQAKDTKPTISEEDVKTVMAQTGCTHDDAVAAINESGGDLAQAILNLSS